MSSTTTNYISKIKQNYPVAGVDNDSQGFRDNFKNIGLALTNINTELDDLSINAFRLNQTNNFDANIIQDAAFQDCSNIVYDDTILAKTGDVNVNYINGSYQKFRLASGSHQFSVYNWPGAGRSGSIFIHVTTSSGAVTSISFTASSLINLGTEVYPYQLSENKPYVFELISDGSENTVFLKKLNDEIAAAEDNDIDSENVTADYLTSQIEFDLQGNKLKTNSARDIVMSIGDQAGELALVPNQVTTVFSAVVLDPPFSSTIANKFTVASNVGIRIGAKFTFISNTLTNVYTVTDINGTTISTQNYESTSLDSSQIGGSITFTSALPTTATNVAIMRSVAPTTSTAVKGDLKGQIYASSTTLSVSYADYTPNTTNWFSIEKGESTATENNNKLATTDLIHKILPFGSIIMWYGNVASIPFGWRLCDGATVPGPGGVGSVTVPDLRDRFIIGAKQDDSSIAKTNVTGALTASGGTKDAIVVSHTHNITDNGHFHGPPAGLSTPYVSNSLEGGDGNIDGSSFITPNDRNSVTGDTASAFTGIQIVSTGTSGTNANLPPYIALCYIMKVTG